MNQTEFLDTIKNKGALIWGPSNARAIEHANSNLQQKKCAMFPNFMISLYTQTAGINLGTGLYLVQRNYQTETIFQSPVSQI